LKNQSPIKDLPADVDNKVLLRQRNQPALQSDFDGVFVRVPLEAPVGLPPHAGKEPLLDFAWTAFDHP
jgi:hypothetical protein